MDNYAKADSVLIADAAFLPLYYGHKISRLWAPKLLKFLNQRGIKNG
jgi:hypothetical protein